MGQTSRGRAHAAAVVIIKSEPLTIQDGRFQRGDQAVARAAPIRKVDAHPVRLPAAEKSAQFAQRLPVGCAGGSERLQSGEHILLFCGADHRFVQPETSAEWPRRRPAPALGIDGNARFAERLHVAVNRPHGNLKRLGQLRRGHAFPFQQDIEQAEKAADWHVVHFLRRVSYHSGDVLASRNGSCYHVNHRKGGASCRFAR